MTKFNPFIKLVVVGDSFVGKTWLISSFVFQDFPIENHPTLYGKLFCQLLVILEVH